MRRPQGDQPWLAATSIVCGSAWETARFCIHALFCLILTQEEKMGKAIRISVALDQLTLEKLTVLADANGRSRSSMVRWLILQAPSPGDETVVRQPMRAPLQTGEKGVRDA